MRNMTEIVRIRTKKSKSSNIFVIRKIKNQKKWTREEDELLIRLAEQYNEKHWKEISKKFMNKNSLQCFSRYKRIRPGIVKGSWKKEEDYRIIDLVFKYGKSWSKISKILGTRNGKQIRDRFINVLDPEIRKGKFSDEEDQKLIHLFKQYGPKWATIAKFYPNRTADMIKNRFHSSIKKKLGNDSFDKDSFIIKENEMTFTNKLLDDNYTQENNANYNLMQHSNTNFSFQPENKLLNLNNLIDSPSRQSLTTSNGEQSLQHQMDSHLAESNEHTNLTPGMYNYQEIDEIWISCANRGGIFSNNETDFKGDYDGNFNWNFEDYFTI